MPEQTIYNMFTYRMEREISVFGKWIRNKRTEQGLSMRDLAERTNGACSHSYIGQIETGRAGKKGLFRPNLEIVDAIAKALGCPTDEARLAAGYAPKTITRRPETIPELVAALEQLGIEAPQPFGGYPKDDDGEGYREVVERCRNNPLTPLFSIAGTCIANAALQSNKPSVYLAFTRK